MTARHIQMKIAAIGMEKSMQRRDPRQERSRIPCVRVVFEIVDDIYSQIADAGQDHNNYGPEKPYQWVGQQTSNHHNQVLLSCRQRKLRSE